jgi:imidazole glycerol-phosphate synthase subunit HisH
MSASETIAIIDYQMGNLRSVQKAIEHVGGRAVVSSDPEIIAGADKVILPGVGAFGDAMRELSSRGLVEAIHSFLRTERPFFGICLGAQLLFDVGFEGGQQAGLGIIPGQVVRFQLPSEYKVPHMGWNGVAATLPTKMLNGIPEGAHFYFVHSYYCVPTNRSDVWLEADYGGPFCAAVHRNNIYATQFHPEKSQRDGLQLLKNFIDC